MGLLRLLLLVILGVLLYRMLRDWRAQRASRKPPHPRDQGKMLACEHCGLYFPEQDAVRDGGHVYCSDAHRRAHKQPHTQNGA